MGFEQQLEPMWLSRASERIWRGSYKNKAWKHLVSALTSKKVGSIWQDVSPAHDLCTHGRQMVLQEQAWKHLVNAKSWFL